MRERWTRRRARELAAVGSWTFVEWEALVVRYDGCCAYCGVRGKLTVDHRVPLSRGGSNSIDNILPACASCNRSKGARTEEEFMLVLAERRAVATIALTDVA